MRQEVERQCHPGGWDGQRGPEGGTSSAGGENFFGGGSGFLAGGRSGATDDGQTVRFEMIE